jgi:hypothetical protein
MNESLVQKIVNRSNRNLLILCVLGIIIVAALFILNMRYFYNFIVGPVEISSASLVALPAADTPQRYWLKVNGQELVDTGIQYVSTSKNGSKTVDNSYYAMLLEKRLLLVKIPGEPGVDSLPANQTGWLSEIASDENQKIIQALEIESPAIKGLFLPFKLETGDFRTNGYIGLVIGGIVLLLCLWGVVLVVQRTANPNNHPVLRALARFGPVDFVVSRIDAEMAAVHTTLGKLNLTNSWLIYDDKANLLATRYEDVIWIYKHVTTHRSYGIAVSKTYAAMVCDKFGVKLTLVAGNKEAKVDEMLSALVTRAPWAVIGYSNELETAWSQNRAGFIETVQRRKAGG